MHSISDILVMFDERETLRKRLQLSVLFKSFLFQANCTHFCAQKILQGL